MDAASGYQDIALTADLLAPAEISAPGEVTGLSEARSGETFFKVVVPEGTALLRATLTGAGDADLFLAKDRIPLCGSVLVSLPCDLDVASESDGPYEAFTLASPAAGDYFLTVYGFNAYQDVALRVSFTAPDVEPAAATDGAAFQLTNAPGGIASLFGVGLSDTTESATSLPLPKQLGGVRVIVGGIEAALFFVSPGQINFQFPANISPGLSAPLYVLKNGDALRFDPRNLPRRRSADLPQPEYDVADHRARRRRYAGDARESRPSAAKRSWSTSPESAS